ncbi:MAG: hypothetical protein LUG99_10835 [Lachnospiraceae bacterium]|nr:hypothetical protein [Lachnospiraceae bacterium]
MWWKKHISDIFSWVLAVVGIFTTIIAARIAVSNGFFTVLIGVLAADVLLVVAWLVVLYLKFSYEKEKKNLEERIKNLEDEKESARKEFLQKESDSKIISDKHLSETKKQVSAMIMGFKNSSKMYNELCNRIPGITASSYRLLAGTEVMQEQDNEQIKNIILNSHNDFSTGLFTLFKQYTSNLLNYTVSIIGEYLDLHQRSIQVSTTVKLFDRPYYTHDDEGRNKILVYTAFRDKITYEEHEREIGENSYTIDGNVDFLRCIKKEHYIVNNAQKHDSNYWNEHVDFDAYYNCAVVVPIRAKLPEGSFKILGYLCCDCKNSDLDKQIFDTETANILFTLAQMYSNFLEALEANWIDRLSNIDGVADSFLGVICEKTYTGKNEP